MEDIIIIMGIPHTKRGDDMKKYFITIESVESANSKDAILVFAKRIIAFVLVLVLIAICCDFFIIKHPYVLNYKTKLFHEEWCSAAPYEANYYGTKLKIIPGSVLCRVFLCPQEKKRGV